MKKFLLRLLIVVGLLTSTSAQAGSFGRYGLGVFNSADYGRAETKVFSLGYEEDWLGPLIGQYEAGVFSDQGGNGRKSSGFGNVSVGVEVDPGTLVLRSLWGIGLITCPDAMLGGPFQFNQDLFVGIRDSKKNMIGLDYKHISSAGLEDPNKGRDFIAVQVEIPW